MDQPPPVSNFFKQAGNSSERAAEAVKPFLIIITRTDAFKTWVKSSLLVRKLKSCAAFFES